jgi:hypothetical protein
LTICSLRTYREGTEELENANTHFASGPDLIEHLWA